MPKNARKSTHHIHRHFRRADPRLAKVLAKMKSIAVPKATSSRHFFAKLCRDIISQQLAGSAADAIQLRFMGLFGKEGPTPRRVLALAGARLRGIGMSWAKARAVKDLAAKVVGGHVDLARLPRLDDEAAIAELLKVKGIGRWTAEMFLIFSLGREDVFSFGDLGLRKGMERVYGKRGVRTQKAMERLALRWAPYRSYASLALWHVNDSAK